MTVGTGEGLNSAALKLELLLRERLGPEKLGRYLRGGRSVSLTPAGDVQVTVPSPLVAGIVERDFVEVIARSAAEALCVHKAPSVRIRVEPMVIAAAAGGVTNPKHGVYAEVPGAPVASERANRSPQRMRVSPVRYRLSDFVVLGSNRLAYELAVRTARGETGPGVLVISAATGQGKTHLLHAMAAEAHAAHAGSTVITVTAEQFVNEYIQACRLQRTDELRKRYRRCDLLCIDDLSALTGKPGTQQELVATIDAVVQRGGRVALTGKCAPREMKGFSETLQSRLVAALHASMGTPDAAGVEKLLIALSRRRGLALDAAALGLMVRSALDSASPQSVRTVSVRDLEGLITKVEAVHRLLGHYTDNAGAARGGANAHDREPVAVRVGMLCVQQALGTADLPGDPARLSPINERNATLTGGEPEPAAFLRHAPGQRAVRMADIVRRVCTRLNVEPEELASRGRHERVVLARALTTYLARKLTSLSYPEIARAIGRPNHSTVITAHRRLDKQIASGITLAGLNQTLSELCRSMHEELRSSIA
ncbi:MAG: ATP-binding protein [Phycisphaerales bacterium]|nr:ATP-binding protein [Phycisphaerales bacterium]